MLVFFLTFWTRSPAPSFYTGPCKLCGPHLWPHLLASIVRAQMRIPHAWSKTSPPLTSMFSLTESREIQNASNGEEAKSQLLLSWTPHSQCKCSVNLTISPSWMTTTRCPPPYTNSSPVWSAFWTSVVTPIGYNSCLKLNFRAPFLSPNSNSYNGLYHLSFLIPTTPLHNYWA